MASGPKALIEEKEILSRIKEFPSCLDLHCPRLSVSRLLARLNSLIEEDEDDDICEEESIFKLNFETWVYLKLDDLQQAIRINDEVIAKTNWGNMMSVGNRVILSWNDGDESHSLECLDKLEAMKKDSTFDTTVATARAELAYSYRRIGGPQNLWKSMQIFEDVLKSNPENYHWKLCLGVVYRRALHMNIYTAISDKITWEDCLRNAKKYLTDVSQNCRDNRLRGPAFSELAVICHDAHSVMHYDAFKNKYKSIIATLHPKELCEWAMKCDSRSVWVLANCGKVLRHSDLDQAIRCLEKSIEIRQNTSVYHQLGLAYQKKSKPKERDRRPKSTSVFFEKAEKHFESAITISHGTNIPAVVNLGFLLKSASRIEEALKKFNQVTNNASGECLPTIVTAYEQAGICYGMLGCEKKMEEKLTRAISCASKMASTVPELRDCTPELWRSFKIMRGRLGREQESPIKNKKLVRLLELVKDYKGIVKVLQTLFTHSEDALDDVQVVRAGLESYLNLKEYENALVFLNMVSTRPNLARTEMWRSKDMMDFRTKVVLSASFDRLARDGGDARFTFQEVFELQYGKCAGNLPDDEMQGGDSGLETLSDGLFVFDDSSGFVPHSVRALHTVCTRVYGLDVARNLKGCARLGPKLNVQLEEMKRYQVVILVLDDERDPEFQGLLELIPSLKTEEPPHPTVLILDIGQKQTPVITGLKSCRRKKMADIGSVRVPQGGARRDEGQQTESEVVREVFDGNVDAVMKLFCFLIDKEWPLP